MSADVRLLRIATAIAQTDVRWTGTADECLSIRLILSASDVHRRMIMRAGVRRIGCLPARSR